MGCVLGLITVAAIFLSLIERRIIDCEGHLYQTCNREIEMRDYRGEDSSFIFIKMEEKMKLSRENYSSPNRKI